MPEGFLHWPLYVPYALYGEVDHVYGWKAFNAKNGFTAAQTALNVVETVMYLVYLYMLWTRADKTLDGVKRTLSGRDGALAVWCLDCPSGLHDLQVWGRYSRWLDTCFKSIVKDRIE
ncbi:hypothetical protein LB505_000317 [Fusarium chuoi]|nr:hypothetical protein LB505_000317 [Fusarium chuoi]